MIGTIEGEIMILDTFTLKVKRNLKTKKLKILDLTPSSGSMDHQNEFEIKQPLNS